MVYFDQILMAILRHPMPCGDYVRYVDLMSPLRRRDVVEARTLFCVLAQKFTQASSVQIGWLLNRDHSTVLHALKEFRHKESYYQNIYDSLCGELCKLQFGKRQNRERAILTLRDVAA